MTDQKNIAKNYNSVALFKVFGVSADVSREYISH